MRIVIYESSSKGGCYEYAQYLHRYFLQQHVQVLLLVPENSPASPFQADSTTRLPILISDNIVDNKWHAKFRFLYRQVVNPIRFLLFLSKQPASIVVWNDFEQLTAPFWTLLLRLIAYKHTHTVVLHDPDRDNYPPSKWYSEWCMKAMMRVMHIGFYHDFLPNKNYYSNTKTTYRSILHGVFDQHAVDETLLNSLTHHKKDDLLITVLGNIREEKNYRLIIQSLPQLSGVKLLIAGAPANSSMDIQGLKELAIELKVDAQIIWHIQFLTDQEMAACIQASDVILLYYQKQFTSQSGILNLIAPYRKKFVYSEMESGLSKVAHTYGLGFPCKPDSVHDFVDCIHHIQHTRDVQTPSHWDQYLAKADWSSMYKELQLTHTHGK